MNLSLAHKADFMLGRMHIDVHLVKGNLKKQHGHRILAFHQTSGIAGKQGVLNDPGP